MHLALITNFAPDRRANGEYGLHLLESLRQARPASRVSVLAGIAPCSTVSDHDPAVQRVWRYDSWRLILDLWQSLSRLRPDLILINTSFNSWGCRTANMAGFMALALLARRWPTAALVHYLPQTLSLNRGYRLSQVDWMGIEIACRLLAQAKLVGFTLERDRRYFTSRYAHHNCRQVEHGLLGGTSAQPLPQRSTVLAFGYWGPNKNLASVLNALENHPNIHLMVAGGSHPNFPHYLEELRSGCRLPNVEWLGYVDEEQIPRIFAESSLVVLPYEGDTGTSGVLHLACQHSRAVLASQVPVLIDESQRLGLTVNFYSDAADLDSKLALAHNRSLMAQQGSQNGRAVGPLSTGQQLWPELERLLR